MVDTLKLSYLLLDSEENDSTSFLHLDLDVHNIHILTILYHPNCIACGHNTTMIYNNSHAASSACLRISGFYIL